MVEYSPETRAKIQEVIDESKARGGESENSNSKSDARESGNPSFRDDPKEQSDLEKYLAENPPKKS